MAGRFHPTGVSTAITSPHKDSGPLKGAAAQSMSVTSHQAAWPPDLPPSSHSPTLTTVSIADQEGLQELTRKGRKCFKEMHFFILFYFILFYFILFWHARKAM